MARAPLFSKTNFSSPAGIFLCYVLAAFVLLMGFRAVFPGEEPPLPIFSVSWRLVRGILLFVELFPALAMSALVIPYGLTVRTELPAARFSPEFMENMKQPVITAIVAAALYGALFSLVMPLAGSGEEDMRFRGKLYGESADKAYAQAGEGDWIEAGRFVEICERVWPRSPALAELRNRIDLELEGARFTLDSRNQEKGAGGGRPDTGARVPVDVQEALDFAEAAFAEERYFDSHWLAVLAGRLARTGSPEVAEASRMAARAWNAVASLAPNSREQENFRLYRIKQSGYEAMVAGDWIRGYYIFRELAALTPNDPDVSNFLAVCEQGTLGIAFFADELEMTLGDILTSAIFSIPRRTPAGTPDGRYLLRAGSLSTFADYSYGFDMELLVIDGAGRLFSRMEAPYAKFLPKTLGGKQRVVLLLQALDREDQSLRWGPVWSGPGREEPGQAEAVLDLSYDDFLLIAKIRRGIENLLGPELVTAYRTLEPYGYIPEVFLAEIVSRLAEPVFFLPLAILILVIGWRYRSRKRQPVILVPSLFLLPLVFHNLFHICRSLVNTLGIWAALSLSYPAAMVCFAAGALVLFVITLVILASQQG